MPNQQISKFHTKFIITKKLVLMHGHGMRFFMNFFKHCDKFGLHTT